MEQQCILKTYNWDDFCYNIKHVNRFHSQQVNFDQLENLLKNMVIDIPKGTLKLFRSRICDEDSYTSGYSTRKMGSATSSINNGWTNKFRRYSMLVSGR